MRHLQTLGLERRYGLEVEEMICEACRKPIGRVDALLYRGVRSSELATHASYPCTKRWLVFDRLRERFIDDDEA